MEKFFQELTWRDYWQKKWQMLPEIDKDLNYKQNPVAHRTFLKMYLMLIQKLLLWIMP